MIDLSRLANIAEIVGALIVIGGVFFAIMQMRQIRQQRREMAAIELFRFFGRPQFSQSYLRILQLPEGLNKNQLCQHAEDIDSVRWSSAQRWKISASWSITESSLQSWLEI